MARFLTVNDFSGSPPVPRGNQDFNLDPERTAADSEFGVEPASYGVSPNTGKKLGDQGPCLYFGPQGQRCSRPATANGFCARHTPAQAEQSASPGAALPSAGRKPRIVALGLAALVFFDYFWPIISEVVREIIRLTHTH